MRSVDVRVDVSDVTDLDGELFTTSTVYLSALFASVALDVLVR